MLQNIQVYFTFFVSPNRYTVKFQYSATNEIHERGLAVNDTALYCIKQIHVLGVIH